MFLSRIKELDDKTFYKYLESFCKRRKGNNILDKELESFVTEIINENPAIDVNIIESAFIAEGTNRFGWLVKYLLVRAPNYFIR